MNNDFDVIVYGTVCLDAIWRVERLPPPGGYMDIDDELKAIGGEAGNTAMALTHWGVHVALIGNALGDDEDGALLRRLLARDAPKLDTRFLTTSPEVHTPFCLCIATPDGYRTMYGLHFRDMRCPPLDTALARSARIFTMDPNAWDAGKQAAFVAADAGMEVIAMDYARDVVVNGIAGIVLTSTDHIGREASEDELAAFARQVCVTQDVTTILTRGEQGSLVAVKGSGGEIVRIPAYVAPAMVDSTGAGDLFRAGLIYGRLQGWELLRTIRFASAAAALNCGAMGGWRGVRSVEEITAFQTQAALHP